MLNRGGQGVRGPLDKLQGDMCSLSNSDTTSGAERNNLLPGRFSDYPGGRSRRCYADTSGLRRWSSAAWIMLVRPSEEESS